MGAYAVKQGYIVIELYESTGMPKQVVMNLDANYDSLNSYCDNEDPKFETSVIHYCPWCGGDAIGK